VRASVEWAPIGRESFEEALQYLAEFNPAATEAFRERILNGVESLREFPELGVPVAGYEASSGRRRLIIGRHVVSYRLAETAS